jgi:AraC-like DNA-binding protein
LEKEKTAIREKANRGSGKIGNNAGPIINTAYEFGSKSAEVFSRVFMKLFGIFPNLEPVQKELLLAVIRSIFKDG